MFTRKITVNIIGQTPGRARIIDGNSNQYALGAFLQRDTPGFVLKKEC